MFLSIINKLTYMATLVTEDMTPEQKNAAEQEALGNILKNPNEGGAATPTGLLGAGANVPKVLEENPALRSLVEEQIRTQTGQRQQTPADIVTSEQTRTQVDGAMNEIDEAETFFSTPDATPSTDLTIPNTSITTAEGFLESPNAPKVDEATGLTANQNDLFARAEDLSNQRYDSLVENLKFQMEETLRETRESQKKTRGSSRSQFAKMGALNVTTAGVSYMNDLKNKHDQQLASIRIQAMRVIAEARQAQASGDLERLATKIDTIRQNRIDIDTANKNFLDNIQQMQEIQQFQRDSVGTTVDALAANDVEVPDDYFAQLDKSAGYAPGTSKGLYNLAREEREFNLEMQDITTQQLNLDLATKTATLINDMPVGGPPVVLNGVRYSVLGKGNAVTGTEEDGSGRYLWSTNLETGLTTVTQLGSPKGMEYMDFQSDQGAIVRIYEDGSRDVFDPNQPNYGFAVGGIVAEFPQGSITPFDRPEERGGKWMAAQCGAWVNDLTGLGVGDSYQSKLDLMDPEITAENARVGDVFIQELGTTGHIGIINSKFTDPETGQLMFRVSESNWIQNEEGIGLITHDRNVPASQMTGFARPGFVNESFNFGTDSFGATNQYTFKGETESKAPIIKKIHGRDLQWNEELETWQEPDIVVTAEQVESDNKKAQDVLEIINTFDQMTDKEIGRFIGPIDSAKLTRRSSAKKIDFYSKLNRLKNILTLDNLKLMTGVLTDKDIELLASAATELNPAGSIEAFREELSRLKQEMNAEPVRPQQTAPETPAGSIRVRLKATGQTGSIPEGEFDPNIYERL